MAAPTSRSSLASVPTMFRAMMDAAACPSRQAFTVWPKALTRSPASLISTLTVEPHSLEWAVAVASASASRSVRGMLADSSRMRWL